MALGRALVRDPKAFLFDEPLSNLDAKLRVEMRTELRILHRRLAATMIYVTHDQEEALSLADHMAVLKDGEVIQTGAPRELYDHPTDQFTASFLGDTNFVQGRVIETNGPEVVVETPLGRLRSRGSRPERLADDVMVSIRPESIRLGAEIKDDNQTSMTVAGTMFLGQTAEVALTNGKATLRALELHPRVVRNGGDTLQASFSPDDVVLLSV